MVIPYCAPLAWYMARAAGCAQATPVTHPNRCLIAGPLTLTVPVAGGSRAIKRLPWRELEVSDHGRWQHVHLGALDAAYGRTPYFIHYFPAVEAVISATPRRLADLCAAVDAAVAAALRIDRLAPELSTPAALRRGRELLPLADPALSILDPLFRLGPEAIFLLAPTLSSQNIG